MKQFRIKNNGKSFGSLKLFNFKLPKNEDVIFNTLTDCKIEGDPIYYEVDGLSTIKSIVLGYETDGDTVKKIVNQIKFENNIRDDYVHPGEIIKLVNAPVKYRNTDINERIKYIVERYQNVKSSINNCDLDEDDEFTSEIIMNYIGPMINDGKYCSIDDVYQCMEKVLMLEDIVSRYREKKIRS